MLPSTGQTGQTGHLSCPVWLKTGQDGQEPYVIGFLSGLGEGVVSHIMRDDLRGPARHIRCRSPRARRSDDFL